VIHTEPYMHVAHVTVRVFGPLWMAGRMTKREPYVCGKTRRQ
jgi:hypothetical protein